MTDEQKLHCVMRELALRRKVYPKWVAQGRLSHDKATYEYDCMKEIVEDYRKICAKQLNLELVK